MAFGGIAAPGQNALVVDVAWFKQPWNLLRVAGALLIVAGACGLPVVRAR
jgi:multidrug transporter EmrE-like cation transporter